MTVTRLARAVLRQLDPETAHDATLWLLRRGLGPVTRGLDDPILACRLWGRDITNPIGLAAGFDKNAEVIGPMLRLGFGAVEVGSVTPKAQPGNPKPRIFRLIEDDAAINRMGFPSRGMAEAATHLARWRKRHGAGPGLVGVNLGKNKDAEDAAADYAAGARVLGPLADYLVVNVSSPNTPGLRALQERAELEQVIERVRDALGQTATRAGRQAPPLLIKIAPDLTEADLEDIAALAVVQNLGGLIISNTTIARPPGLKGRHQREAGGLSGRPLFEPSTRVLGHVYRLTGGRVPLIGVGGVSGAKDAYAKVRAGASLVQLYTALAYQGPDLIPRLKTGLADLLRRDGYGALSEVVGADHR